MNGKSETSDTTPVDVVMFGGEHKTVHVRKFAHISDVRLFCALWPDMAGMAELAAIEPAGWANDVTPDSIFCVVAKACQVNLGTFGTIARAAEALKGPHQAAAVAPPIPIDRRRAPTRRRHKL